MSDNLNHSIKKHPKLVGSRNYCAMKNCSPGEVASTEFKGMWEPYRHHGALKESPKPIKIKCSDGCGFQLRFEHLFARV